jgi:hypothetical protein
MPTTSMPDVVTDAQWEESQRLFEERLARTTKGHSMEEEKYDLIVEALSRWDEMTPSERNVLCNGNHKSWYNNYELSCVPAADGSGRYPLIKKLTGKIVIHSDNLYKELKHVHTSSACAVP